MEPEPDKLDLSVLDPGRDPARWDRTVAGVAARAIELRRFRRAVIRRGMVGLALAAAAAIGLWWRVPRREPAPPPRSSDLLDWAIRDVGADDVLALGPGGRDAQ